jgi:acyl-CoA thioesterase I
MTIAKHMLFIGDSITDAARNRLDPIDLGHGYVKLLHNYFHTHHPETRLSNQGIAGERLETLLQRLELAYATKPNIITVMIGINHVIHRYKRNHSTTIEHFTENYAQLLRNLKQSGVSIIVMEPFLLPVIGGDDAIPYHPHIQHWADWRADLNPKLDSIRALCLLEQVPLVPLDGIFAAAATRQPPSHWAPDGVHPTLHGHALIANAWLQYSQLPVHA